jgi:hypothetical protein
LETPGCPVEVPDRTACAYEKGIGVGIAPYTKEIVRGTAGVTPVPATRPERRVDEHAFQSSSGSDVKTVAPRENKDAVPRLPRVKIPSMIPARAVIVIYDERRLRPDRNESARSGGRGDAE